MSLSAPHAKRRRTAEEIRMTPPRNRNRVALGAPSEARPRHVMAPKSRKLPECTGSITQNAPLPQWQRGVQIAREPFGLQDPYPIPP